MPENDPLFAVRQTAANNAFLRNVKATMNGQIFKKTSALLNAQGYDDAMEFLLSFFNVAVREARKLFFLAESHQELQAAARVEMRAVEASAENTADAE